MEHYKKPRRKHIRSITLAPSVHERMQALCEYLGVSVTSYIAQALGKALANDEAQFMTSPTAQDLLNRSTATINPQGMTLQQNEVIND